jgi:multiple sugar transport system ATP-binding protein
MGEVVLNSVDKAFGQVQVIKSVDLSIKESEFCVFVGPSGCGKSTLLRLVAGLEDVTSGSISIGGRDVTELPPAQRGIAMVFQSYALYPHMNVANNITFGLRTARNEKGDTERRLARAAKMLQLDALLDRYPRQLSGGQRQRVAIGRAIVREPEVFLFDEPLSNLDAALRTQMRIEIGTLHQELGATMIYVTHDQVEAMTMADKIVVLNAGRVEQVGAPLELYHRPANLFVAGFIGSPRMNFMTTRIIKSSGGLARVELPGGGIVSVPIQGIRFQKNAPIVLGIRPEHLTVGDNAGAPVPADLDDGDAEPDAAATRGPPPGLLGIGQPMHAKGTDGYIPGTVRLAEHLGAETILYVDVPGSEPILIRSAGITREKPGNPVRIRVPADACLIFQPDGPALVTASAAIN